MTRLGFKFACLIIPTCVLTIVAFGALSIGETKVAVTFAGGHDTDPADKGRPVVLIAAALGVKTEVFRDAFSKVKPAKDGKPTKEEADRNKEVLMKALKPHGVTPERLDEVSDYYRYKPGKGSLWKNTPAKAYAVIDNGKVQRMMITEPGNGYSSTPTATIQGMEKVKLKVTIQFSKDFKKNGSVTKVDVE